MGRRQWAAVAAGGLLASVAVALWTPTASAGPALSTVLDTTSADGTVVGIGGVSTDGSFLVGSTAFASRLVDLASGSVRALPVNPKAITGGGTTLLFETNERFAPEDTDSGADVYSYRLADGTVRLLSTGMPGAQFQLIDADDAGDALLLGISGSTGSHVFVGNGTTMVALGAGINAHNVIPGGISGDGRSVLINYDSVWYLEDVGTGVRRAIPAIDPTSNAVMSKNGRRAVFVGGNETKQVQMVDLTSGAVTTIGPYFGFGGPRSFAINADGSTVAFIAKSSKPHPDFGGTVGTAYMWRNGVVTEVSVDGNGTPLGAVDAVATTGASSIAFLVRDRDNVIYTTRSVPQLHPGDPAPPVFAIAPPPPPVPSPQPEWGAPSAFTAITPKRILDTRDRTQPPGAQPGVGTTIEVQRAAAGVSPDATAVAVQVTATEGSAVGFVGVTPHGSPVGKTSTLNLDVPGETIANFAISAVGANGNIDVYTSLPTDVIVDLLGWWTPAPREVAAGRYTAVDPQRILDTRPESRIGYSGAKPGPGTVTSIKVTGTAGVPSSGVSAVAVNITLDQSEAPGFVQSGPAASLVPGTTSSANVSRAGQVVAATTIVPVDADGRIALFNQSATHLIVDLAGWFSDATATPSTIGRFVPAVDVTRTFDSRLSGRIGFTGTALPVGTVVDTTAAGQPRSDGGSIGALVGNLTITNTASAGYVQLGQTSSIQPGTTSNINASGPSETLANAFVTPATMGLSLFTVFGTDVILDVSGYMTS